MIKKKRWRYYCEYCKKSGGSKYHMANHEKHCTLNPDRECGMCELMDEAQKKMSELLNCLPEPESFKLEEFGWVTYPGLDKAIEEAMPELREKTNGCPACIMAALRQKEIPVPMVESFDYKKEFNALLQEINEANAECRY